MTSMVQAGPAPLISEADRLRHRREWMAYMAISLGAFIAILDIQIVASSLNQLQAGLSASADEIQWIQTAYLIAEVIAIPLSGYLARLLSTRVYFALSAAGFTLASLACAAAWNLESMVLFRIIQGFLGGGMIPTAFSAMFLLFPEPERRMAPQMVGGLLTIFAPSIGPTLGGYITTIASWHWLFLLNLIPGIICTWGVWKLVSFDKAQPGVFRMTDWPGLTYMALFLGSLTFALDEGPRKDWFSSHLVGFCVVLAAVTGVLFVRRVLSYRHPIVALRAFGNRNFMLCCLISVVLGMSMFTLIYVTPLFLGQVRHYDSLAIGNVMMVQGVAMFLAAPLGAVVARRLDPRVVIMIGLVMVAYGSWINSHMTADWGFTEMVLPQALRGVGTILAFIPMTNLAMGTMESDEVQDASGLYALMRNLGGALGLAMVATVLNSRIWHHWQGLVVAMPHGSRPAEDFLASLGGGPAALEVLRGMALRQVTTMAYNDVYLILAATILLAVLMVPLIEKPTHDHGDIGAH